MYTLAWSIGDARPTFIRTIRFTRGVLFLARVPQLDAKKRAVDELALMAFPMGAKET
jgi:hypothetical protein